MSKTSSELETVENIRSAFKEHLEVGHFSRVKQCISEMQMFDEQEARVMEWEYREKLKKNL